MNDDATSLGHDEIWDDSVLIESWNEALEEYKKYHSILANGGDLQDLQDSTLSKTQTYGQQNPQVTHGNIDSKTDNVVVEEACFKELPRSSATSIPAAAVPPQVVLGSVQDEGLKRLLMSWYYAGYYTGLYEGQQQMQQRES